MSRKFWILTAFTLLVTGFPLAGIILAGRQASLFTSFPPLTVPASHEPFSWPVFILYLIPACGLIILAGLISLRKPVGAETKISPHSGHLPWWGWMGLAVMGVSWFLAWTRISWFAPFQPHTFLPLWISYIIFVNGLCVRQSGSCPLRDESGFFIVLFPVSCVFWWLFEYLNQYVQNWYYMGVDYGPVLYSLHASISFSTVLPAVYTTWRWISDLVWLKKRFYGLPSLTKYTPYSLNWTVLIISCAGLAGVGLWPDELFALLWIAPLLILCTLKHIGKQQTFFTYIVNGDWRPTVSASIAALLCGFCWEMWNYYSLAKWTYNIPFVHRFTLFEMPALGYLGYLPFGLLCIEVITLLRKESDK